MKPFSLTYMSMPTVILFVLIFAKFKRATVLFFYGIILVFMSAESEFES